MKLSTRIKRRVARLFKSPDSEKPRRKSTKYSHLPLPYRGYLYDELLSHSSTEHWQGKRMLEIGPRDGDDSKRLSALNPAEFVMIDLPEKTDRVKGWLNDIPEPKQHIEANFAYMSQEEITALGLFDLVWVTGVLYHNAEQMRLLRRLYKMMTVGGYLVLESATLRGDEALQNGDFVQIYYPNRYRDTASITHLPSRGAIKAWLSMVGFRDIVDSQCFEYENADLSSSRYACIARKTSEDAGDAYYHSDDFGGYRFGDST